MIMVGKNSSGDASLTKVLEGIIVSRTDRDKSSDKEKP